MGFFQIVRGAGATSVTAAVYRYGAPPAMHTLAALLHEEAERSAWRSYMADMAWMIARIGYRDQLPRYSDIVHKSDEPKDDRSAEEIIEDLRKKLGGE